jgi:hypothetical protein
MLSGGDLSIPLAGSVPPQHLMRPVHSADRRHACLFHWQAARPCCCMHYTHHHSYVPRKLPLCISTTRVVYIWAPKDLSGVTCISCSMYFFHYVPGPTCRGSATLYVPPLGYKREGTQRYKASQLKHSSPQVTQTHILNTTHSGVGYCALAAQTTLNSCVFSCVHPPSSK